MSVAARQWAEMMQVSGLLSKPGTVNLGFRPWAQSVLKWPHPRVHQLTMPAIVFGPKLTACDLLLLPSVNGPNLVEQVADLSPANPVSSAFGLLCVRPGLALHCTTWLGFGPALLRVQTPAGVQ